MRAPGSSWLLAAVLSLPASLVTVACSETEPRDRGDASTRVDSSLPPPPPPDASAEACPPNACGPIPDGCTPLPPTDPCGCAGYDCSDCRNTCPPPPEGCFYDPSIPTEAPCDQPLSCEPICEPGCAIACPAPPPGCHYEGGIHEGPCELQTCGTVVCVDPPPPPPGACPGDRGTGRCCTRDADRVDLARPTMRVVGIDITEPAGLANATIISLLQGAIDGERLSWLLRFDDGSPSAPSTLYAADGVSGAGGFMVGDAPPISMPARVVGSSWATEPAIDTLVLTVLNDDGSLLVTIPIDALRFDAITLSADRMCVGERTGRRWMTDGWFSGQLTVSRSRDVIIEPLGMDLCSLLAGSNCDSPSSTWRNPPDVACAEGTECSAWTFTGSIAAAATYVEGF